MVTNPNFTKIERYLNFTGLMSILDEPDVNVTFFAPDNEAFLFLEDAGLAALLLTGFWIEHTECVIAGHFVDGIIDSSQLSDGLVLPTFEENENITVNLNPLEFPQQVEEPTLPELTLLPPTDSSMKSIALCSLLA